MKIRIGNDFKTKWAITWLGEPEDFSDATDMSLFFNIYDKKIELTKDVDYTITDNIIEIDVTPDICNILGVYNLELHYTKPNDDFIDGERRSAVDIDAFRIVSRSEKADSTQDVSIISDAVAIFLDIAYKKLEEIEANEDVRIANEEERVSNENTRINNEQQRQIDASTAIGNAEQATLNANNSAVYANEQGSYAEEMSSHPPTIINDYWHIWNFTTNQYESTGQYARGDSAIDGALVVQEKGQSAVNTMSQKAITDDLALKANQTDLSQLAGDVSVKVRNLITNGDFANDVNGWSGFGMPVEHDSGRLRTDDWGASHNKIISPAMEGLSIGDLLYLRIGVYERSAMPEGANIIRVRINDTVPYIIDEANNPNLIIKNLSGIAAYNGETPTLHIRTYQGEGNSVWIDDVVCINLTETFGAGNEPTEEEMNLLLDMLPVDYFEGEITIPAQKIWQKQIKIQNDLALKANHGYGEGEEPKTLKEVEDAIEDIDNLFKLTDNIYNSNLNKQGYYVNSSGNILSISSSVWELSYQNVEPNTEYVIRNGEQLYSRSIGLLVFLSAEGDTISSINMDSMESFKGGKIINTPDECTMVAFNVLGESIDLDFRDNIEWFKGTETVSDEYMPPLTLKELSPIYNRLEEVENSQTELELKVDDNIYTYDYGSSGDANLVGSSTLLTGGFFVWEALSVDVVLDKVKFNAAGIERVAVWDEEVIFSIGIAMPIPDSEQLEIIEKHSFEYINKGDLEIDISHLNITVPSGGFAVFYYIDVGERSSGARAYPYRYTEATGESQYFRDINVGAKSVPLTFIINQIDLEIVYKRPSPIKDIVLSNKERIEILENADVKQLSEVNINTITDVLFMGSSLTSSHYNPKSMSWIERLNDIVDVSIVNNGVSGHNLIRNMGQLVKNSGIAKDSANTPKNLKPSYIWWNNSANKTPIGEAGFIQLSNAKEITESYGSKMILGSEEDYSKIPKQLEDTYKAFSKQHNIPYSPIIQVWRKCFPIDNPYTGWITNDHAGYRSTSPYMMHKGLLDLIPIGKSVKMYNVRPQFKLGSPTINDLVYDNNNQRLKFFTAISSGSNSIVQTSGLDNLDNHLYDVDGTVDSGVTASQISMMQRGAEIAFNKFGLIEFILDKTCITKGIFTISCSTEPSAVYIAKTKSSIDIYDSSPRTEFISVDFTYSGEEITANINRDDCDIQLFDKVRFIVQCPSSFTLKTPAFSEYNGRDKTVDFNLLSNYKYREYGKEFNIESGFPISGHGWTLSGGAVIKQLPSEIANYTSYNEHKSHLEMPSDTASIVKTVALDEPCAKVAVRVVGCMFPKIATTRFVGTAIADSEYIDATKAQVDTYDYDYGTLSLVINGAIVREEIIMQGWTEMYFEIDTDATDTELEIKIGRKCFVDSSYTNADIPVFIHDVSVQKIK